MQEEEEEKNEGIVSLVHEVLLSRLLVQLSAIFASTAGFVVKKGDGCAQEAAREHTFAFCYLFFLFGSNFCFRPRVSPFDAVTEGMTQSFPFLSPSLLPSLLSSLASFFFLSRAAADAQFC